MIELRLLISTHTNRSVSPPSFPIPVADRSSLQKAKMAPSEAPDSGTSPLQPHHHHHHLQTRVLPVDITKIGKFVFRSPHDSFRGDWHIELAQNSPDAAHLAEAAGQLQRGSTPVAFPTETVYGLGADATNPAAVLGVYSAKKRPPDNPLIVHVSSLSQLRTLLRPPSAGGAGVVDVEDDDPIPAIYHPLISRFWPGPLTIILPLPTPSPLAPQVTSSLPTFGARMPSSRLALALIRLANIPIAAPSANASTKPSPTTAAHVLHDLSGRIDIILDGGPCNVGLESTVVDGLVRPPVILRPGGVPLECLRECPGWQGVVVGYTDRPENGVPRAPGMKYRHYSPDASVILVQGGLTSELVYRFVGQSRSIGVLTTKKWNVNDLTPTPMNAIRDPNSDMPPLPHTPEAPPTSNGTQTSNPMLQTPTSPSSNVQIPTTVHSTLQVPNQSGTTTPIDLWTVNLGPDTVRMAHGLFSALRHLDRKSVGAILVEALRDDEGELATVVMNRLRKAAAMELEA